MEDSKMSKDSKLLNLKKMVRDIEKKIEILEAQKILFQKKITLLEISLKEETSNDTE
jgi:hypothetical protein